MALQTIDQNFATSGMDFAEFREENNRCHGTWSVRRVDENPFRAVIDHFNVSDFGLSRTITSPLTGVRGPDEIGRDESSFFCLMYVTEGTCTIGQGGNRSLVCANDIALWDSARPAISEIHRPLQQLSMTIPRETAIALVPGIEDFCGLAIQGGTPMGRILRSHLLQFSDEILNIPTKAQPSMLQATVHLVGASFHPADEHLNAAIRRPALAKVQDFILANLRNPDLCAQTIADELGYSTSYLHRLFANFDFTVGGWIRRRRLLASKADLARIGPSSATIGQIAIKYGFSDQSHFSRLFKKEFGQSPIAFRKALYN